jgi:hypothetical protein
LRELQDPPGSNRADFATTNAFKIPVDKDAVTGGQNREITTITGYTSYPEREKKSEL